MQFFNASGQEIHDRDEWMRLAPPTAAYHVAGGRSAVEMCRAWMEGDAVDRVTTLLSRHTRYNSVTLERGIVERLTQFDDNPRGPRHHDLLAIASSRAGRVVLGVEGKADETFGDRLDRHVAKALKRSPSSGAPKRVDQLTRAFFGATLGADASLGAIPYQLLPALVGTLVDARGQDAVEAVVLVHEFRTDRTSDHLQARNAAALDAFLARMHPAAARSGDESAWITEPVTVRGGGRWLPRELPVRFAKLRTDSKSSA
jgi:hypothetical protein